MTTRYIVLCRCGHEGNIKLRENDTSYGSGSHQYYSPENLEGQGFSTDNAGWPEVFRKMQPVCPECGQSLTIDNLSTTT